MQAPSIFSPMTDLAMNFEDMAANTPKRSLFDDIPTPRPTSGVEASLHGKSEAFRRFRAMPMPFSSKLDFSGSSPSLASPFDLSTKKPKPGSLFGKSSSRRSLLESPVVQSPIQRNVPFLDLDESSLDSGVGLDGKSPRLTPRHQLFKSSLSFSPASTDDGFLDLLHDDAPKSNSMSDRFQGLLSNPLLGSNGDFTPKLLRNARQIKNKPSRKRSQPEESETPTVSKRRCSIIEQTTPEKLTIRTVQRTQSEEQIKSALDRDHGEEDVIGDFSKPYCLPTIIGKHSDMKSISPETMFRLLDGDFDDSVEKFTVIDCRYTYEFDGGHIKDALNIWERDTMHKKFITSTELRQPPVDPSKRNILIFHCEFSSERGPRMSRFLRKIDRSLNKESYPALYYPEVYLLEGGYKAFFNFNKTHCEPQTYLPMIHEDYATDLKHFRLKSKSWSGEQSQKTSRHSLRRRRMDLL